jgi:hypothetical protein
MSGMPGTKRAAETDPPSSSSSSSAPSEGRTAHGGGGGGAGGGGLYGITAAQKAFLFLDGPADVLRAATACRRWRELAGAGSVWQAKAEREGILDKAAAFEVEAPAALDGGGGGGGGSGGVSGHEEGGGAWLAFYARVFSLEVRRGHACRLLFAAAPHASCTCSTHSLSAALPPRAHASCVHLFASPHAHVHMHTPAVAARCCVHRGTE